MVIRLFCAAGMSTSLLVKKMEEAAKEKGKDVDIVAYPFTEMERVIEGVDAGDLVIPAPDWMRRAVTGG